MGFVPALKYHWLTQFYDFFIRFFLKERMIRQAFLSLMKCTPDDKILDMGCGTGTFCGLIKEAFPEIELIGADVDRAILTIARKKYPGIPFVEINEKPLFESKYFDKISLMWVLHHLSRAEKIDLLFEMARILRSNGTLYIADWTRPQGFWQRIKFFLVCLVDNFETFKEHREGALPQLFEQAGFREIRLRNTMKTNFGTLAFWECKL